MSFCLMYFVWGIRGVKKSKRHRWIEQLQKGWAHYINSTVAAFLCGITESSLQMFCLSDVFTSTQGTFEDSIEKHQGSVNALSNGWNFILPRTETNAFQFESRFLILSNFSSLHYFKKIPFQIAKVRIWSVYFFHLLPTKHIEFNFLYLYSYGRFLSHLNRKQILPTHWNIGWLWRRMHRLEDAVPSIVALFFFCKILEWKYSIIKWSCWVWPMAYCPRVQTKSAVLKLPSSVLTSFQSWASKLSQWATLA